MPKNRQKLENKLEVRTIIGAVEWLLGAGQDVREIASSDCGGDTVLSYAFDCQGAGGAAGAGL